MKVNKKACRKWTKEDLDYLERHYRTKTNKEIAEKLGRTVDSVTGQGYLRGLSKKKKLWTTKEIEYLKENEGKLTDKDFAKELNTNTTAIRNMRYRLRLKGRSTEYALYKEDRLLAAGTAKEIAEQLGIAESTVRFYGTPSQRRKTSPRARRLVVVNR